MPYRISSHGGTTGGTSTRGMSVITQVGDLLVLFAAIGDNANLSPTATDNQGGTWTRLQAAAFGPHVFSCFVRDTLCASTVTHAIDVITGVNSGGKLVCVNISGMSSAGSAAIRASTSAANGTAATTPATGLTGVLTGNMTITAVANTSVAGTMAPPAGWTERQDQNQITPTLGVEVATRDSGFAGSTPVFGSASPTAYATIAVELVAAAGGPASDAVAEGSASAADMPSNRATFRPSMAEGTPGTAADTPSAVLGLIAEAAVVYPIADIGSSAWLPSEGSSRWAVLDDTDTGNWIYSPDNPTTQSFEELLAPIPSGNTGHGVELSLQAIASNADFEFDLLDGATVRDSWIENVTVAAGIVQRSHSFDPAVIAAIANRADVRIRGFAHGISVSPGATLLAGSYVDIEETPTYYVSSSGGNNSNAGTSSAAPWQTLSKVQAMLGSYTAGTVIAFKRGDVWSEQLTLTALTGGVGNPAVLTAYDSGARPIFDGQSGTRQWALILQNGTNHVVVKHLHFKGGQFDGLRLLGNATDVVIFDCYASLNGRHGFENEATPGVTNQTEIEYNACESYKNFNSGYVAYNVSGGIDYYNCKATYNGTGVAGHGFSVYFASFCHYHGCEAAYTNIDETTGLPNAFLTEGIGLALDDYASDCTIEYCYSHRNEGEGIAAGHQGDRNTIRYNKVVLNGSIGIMLNGFSASSDNILIYNNTIVSNGGNGINVAQPTAGCMIKNNLVASNTGWGIAFSGTNTGYAVANNLINGNSSGATTNVTGATGTITSAPNLDANYVPNVGSPALAAGVAIGSPHHLGLYTGSSWPNTVYLYDQGSSWDIGAYVNG